MSRDGRIGRWLGAWAVWASRHAPWVAAVGLGLSVPFSWYGLANLRIDSDTSRLISDHPAWRRTYLAFEQTFPQFSDEIQIVIDGASPEVAAEAQRRLARALEGSDLFEEIYAPFGGEFFERHALLYLETDELEDLAARLHDYAPLWSRLEEDPSLSGLASAVERIAADSAVDGNAVPVLEALTGAFYASRYGHFFSLSWGEALRGGGSTGSDRRRFVIARPRLEFERSRPAERPIRAIREASNGLNLDLRAVRVRITGAEAVEHESIDSALSEIPRLLFGALLLVSIILLVGLGSVRLVAAALLVLAAGLAATTAFAAAAVGSLNMISIAFAVLYVGLGIDYAIHFLMGYEEAHVETGSHPEALRVTAERTGVALFLSAVTTALCFYSFMATDFTGVADLGKIGGTGMLIGFVATLALLPALLSLRPFRAGGVAGEYAVPEQSIPPWSRSVSRSIDIGRTAMSRLEGFVLRRRGWILATAAGVAAASASLVPWVHFDQNALNLSDPAAESVETYRELLDDPFTASLTVSAVEPDSAAAADLASRLHEVQEVDAVITLDDFVPGDQESKLAILRSAAADLGPPPTGYPDGSVTNDPAASGLERRSRAVERLQAAALDLGFVSDSATRASARRLLFVIHLWKAAQSGWPPRARDALAEELEASLVGTLPLSQARLRQALEAGPVRRQDLPPAMRSRWVAPDGRERVQVLPAEKLDTPKKIRAFVEAVRVEEPNITGTPVNDVGSADVAIRAFQHSFGLALIATAAALLILLGNARASALVLMALLLAGLLTAALSVLVDIPFSIANIITLPLLLGVGVDAGIHIVYRRRSLDHLGGGLLDTATGRAILYSALTTIAGFGNLAIARHRALSGMGGLLTIGMMSVLIYTLVVLPAIMSRPEPAPAVRSTPRGMSND